jgi:hypothetical protein
MNERARLKALLDALDASPRALGRDQCGDWMIRGSAGHIFANKAGFLLYVATDESARRWSNIKGRLAFCLVTQDGDDEGCLMLDRLPTATEATTIREAIGIRKRRHMTAEALAQLDVARNAAKSASGAQAFAKVA